MQSQLKTQTLPLLQNGDSGNAVRLLQKLLLTLGYVPLRFDAQFGNETKGRVQEFQRDHNLTDDGIVGVNTWTALTSALPVLPD